MMKVFKILGAFLCVVCLIVIGKFSWALIYSASSVTCLESKPEDTFNFGEALAIDDNYIAVGDPEANRVVIYSYNKSKDKWSRTREIYPPKNSIIDRVGYGFGSSLVFNQNQLIIGAYSDLVPSIVNNDNEIEDNKSRYSYYGSVYSLLLDENNRNTLREIDLPEQIKLTGYSIAKFSNKIALGATTGRETGKKPGKVLIVNPTTLKLEAVIEPPIPPAKRGNFGSNIAGDSKSLIIGSPNIPALGGVYFANEKGELVETISISKISSADETRRFGSPVALGDDFFATGTSRWKTSIFKRLSNRWWEIYSVNFRGSLSVIDSQLLVSAGRYPFDKGTQTTIPNHLLVDIKDDLAYMKSEIRWHRGVLFGPAKGLYYGPAEAKGVIDSQYLLLSRNGKVVLLKKNYLPRNYVINRSFCKEK